MKAHVTTYGHPYCGFQTTSKEELDHHMKGGCPKSRHLIDQVRVVEVEGMRIIAGGPRGVARYLEERSK